MSHGKFPTWSYDGVCAVVWKLVAHVHMIQLQQTTGASVVNCVTGGHLLSAP